MQSMTETRSNGIGTNRESVKAVAVIPGKANTIHLREVQKPKVEDVPGGRGVLIKILRVGVDGTDKEINAAEYGAAPAGDDYLIIGHEALDVSRQWDPMTPSSLKSCLFVCVGDCYRLRRSRR